MKSTAYGKYISISSHIVLIALYVLMPFLFSTSLLECETTFRFIALGILLSLSTVILFLSSIMRSQIRMPSVLHIAFYIALFIFLCYSALTVTYSINAGEAIYDLLKLISIAGYFYVIVLLFLNNDTFLSLLLRYSNIAISSFSIIALSQIGLQMGASKKILIDFTLASSLGNKNFYTETMALFLPIAIMAAISLNGIWRLYSYANIVVILITIIALQSLSTWVALPIALVFFIIISLYARKHRLLLVPFFKKKMLWAFSALILICFGLLYHQTNGFGLITKRLHKLNQYAGDNNSYASEGIFQENSISERIYLWQNALRMAKHKPLMGNGMDNWKILVAQYGLPFKPHALTSNIRFMRPHNDLLLLLAEGGLIGLGLYLCLYAIAFMYLIRLIRSGLPDRDKYILLLSASGLIVYLLIACFSLPGDRFYTLILLFQFFAIMIYYYEQQKDRLSGRSRTFTILLSLAMLTSSSCLAYIASQRYASEIHLIYALQAQSKQDWKKMSYHAGAAKSSLFPLDYTATPIAWYQGMASFNMGSPGIAKLYFEEALRRNPYHLQVLNDLATAEDRLDDTANALKHYDQALNMAPYFVSAYMNKVILIYNTGKKESAYDLLLAFPRHQDGSYKNLLRGILTNKIIDAFGDTARSNKYFKSYHFDILRKYDSATVHKLSIEQYAEQDPFSR